MEYLASIQAYVGTDLLGQFFQSTARTYWPYFICSMAIAAVLSLAHRRTEAVLPAHLRSFGRASWLSRSAVNDYALITLNAVIFGAGFIFLLPHVGHSATALANMLHELFPHMATKSLWWAPVLLALCLFLVDDFLRYFTHYMEHRVPMLWQFHKVHHSAEVLNFFTAERHHPLSMLYYSLVFSTGAILTNAVFIFVFGANISPAALLGGNMFWVISNFLGGTLRHSSVWFSFGPALEKWLISPAQHQIHHSTNPAHFDRNFGGTLAIWDRMFGSLYTTTHVREIITYGLDDETQDYRSIRGILLAPLQKSLARSAHTWDAQQQ
jgi:sterol desaturase/sphingolipid hydroxylase (fatty acid hydroxylase superfamily)